MAGEPRSTIDIDFVVALDEGHIAPLVARLDDEFYISAVALTRAVRERRSANLIHHATQVKVDLFIAGGTPLDASQIARRRVYLESRAPILDVADLLQRALSA